MEGKRERERMQERYMRWMMGVSWKIRAVRGEQSASTIGPKCATNPSYVSDWFFQIP